MYAYCTLHFVTFPHCVITFIAGVVVIVIVIVFLYLLLLLIVDHYLLLLLLPLHVVVTLCWLQFGWFRLVQFSIRLVTCDFTVYVVTVYIWLLRVWLGLRFCLLLLLFYYCYYCSIIIPIIVLLLLLRCCFVAFVTILVILPRLHFAWLGVGLVTLGCYSTVTFGYVGYILFICVCISVVVYFVPLTFCIACLGYSCSVVTTTPPHTVPFYTLGSRYILHVYLFVYILVGYCYC